MVHEWTVSSEDFDAITSGKKKFEIRKQDRDFTVGDLLILREGQQGAGTGDRYYVRITYITDVGQPDGQVVLGFEAIEPNSTCNRNGG